MQWKKREEAGEEENTIEEERIGRRRRECNRGREKRYDDGSPSVAFPSSMDPGLSSP